MTTFAQLEALVVDIVQDTSFTSATIRSHLNQGVLEIAGGLQSTLGDHIMAPLPNLYTIGAVDTVTDAAYVAMPATFQRDLQFAANASNVEIDIANSMIGFSQDYPLMSRSGRINEVIEQGGSLYYQGIPTSVETITLHFYRLPVDMSANEDTPDGLPTHLQIPLLVNYTCWEIFKLIEDGVEGQGINTTRYEGLFQKALRTLELSIPHDTRSLFLGD